MDPVLDQQLAWYVAGPLLGLCVIACRWLLNGRLGVTGGYSEIVEQAGRGSARFDWRGWLLIGVAAGGGLFALLSGAQSFEGYGWMTEAFHGSERIAIPVLLLAAGVLIGYGAKLAGGCTSGNGLTGTSMLSPASLAATATFFGTAIVVAHVIEAVI
jgi:uncharacterized protein